MPLPRRTGKGQIVGGASVLVLLVTLLLLAPPSLPLGGRASAPTGVGGTSLPGQALTESGPLTEITAFASPSEISGSTPAGPVGCETVSAATGSCTNAREFVPTPFSGSYNGWGNLTPYLTQSPPARWGEAMTYDANVSAGYVVLFGGMGPNGTLGDTWTFNGTWTNVTPSVITATNSPSPRYGAAMAYDSSDGAVILFGGATSSISGSDPGLLNDTWSFRGGIWTRICAACINGTSEPTPRFESAAANDPSDGGLLLFGGLTETGGTYTAANDTWVFTGVTWDPLPVGPSPPGRYAGGLALNSTNGPVILFGGCGLPQLSGLPSCGDPLNDTWSFSAGTWSRSISPVSPGPRSGIGFASFASQAGGLAVAGLGPTGLLNETWEYDQGAWSDLTDSLLSSPSPRSGIAMAFDAGSGTNYFVVYGGWNGTLLGQTWVYPSPFSPLRVGAPVANVTVTDVGRPIRFNITISGGAGGYNRTWFGLPPGCGTSNTSSLVCHAETPESLSASYSVFVRVRDARGSIVWSASTTVRINAQPTAAINGNPSNTCIAPCTVNFTATVFGGTAPFNFTWNFGDGSGPGFNQYSLHEYRAVGNFSVSVATVDALGVTAPLAFYPAKIGSPLQVQLVADPSTTTRGSRVTFQGAASGGFGLYAFQWSGLPTPCASQDSPTLVCSPNESGTFVVTLQVTDRYGFHSATSVTLVVGPQSSFDWVPILIAITLLGSAGIAVAVWVSRRARRRVAERTSPGNSGLTEPPPRT